MTVTRGRPDLLRAATDPARWVAARACGDRAGAVPSAAMSSSLHPCEARLSGAIAAVPCAPSIAIAT